MTGTAETQPHVGQLVRPFEDDDFSVELVPAGAAYDDQLVIALPPDSLERPRQLELIFLPHKEDDLFMLQLFYAMPFELEPDHAAVVGRLIAHLNGQIPLPCFGMREENHLIFFRCVIPVASRPLDPALEGEAIVASAWVALFQIDRFSEVIELTANGFMTLDQAVKTVDELTQLPPDNR